VSRVLAQGNGAHDPPRPEERGARERNLAENDLCSGVRAEVKVAKHFQRTAKRFRIAGVTEVAGSHVWQQGVGSTCGRARSASMRTPSVTKQLSHVASLLQHQTPRPEANARRRPALAGGGLMQAETQSAADRTAPPKRQPNPP